MSTPVSYVSLAVGVGASGPVERGYEALARAFAEASESVQARWSAPRTVT
ncbi:MAG: hypothetical protein H0V53_12005 [Rubrobacter sp.]|nr:hypothetical protein [Rubrobacter sp.]